MITDAQKLEAWKDRMGQTCRCGAKKPQGHPFCGACWEKLPGPLQYALLEHLTKNFNERYFEAVSVLDLAVVTHPVLPLAVTAAHTIPTIAPGEVIDLGFQGLRLGGLEVKP